MPTLEALERRMRVAGDLQGVVRTMKTISAVGIRQHQIAAEAIRDYVETVELGLAALLHGDDLSRPERLAADGTSVVIIVGSDIGLCGAFNSRVVNHALDASPRSGGGPRLIAVGDRVEAELVRRGRPPAVTFALPTTLEAVGAAIRPVLSELETWRAGNSEGRVLVFYNRQSDDGASHPQMSRLLPIAHQELRRIAARPWRSRRLPIAVGGRAPLLRHLVRQLVFARLHAALIESRTAEHGARLRAMQGADRSIAEKREALEAAYRAARQNAVTDELLDLVAGFEVSSAQGSSGEAPPSQSRRGGW